jgi:hypothetical protein
MSYEMTQNVARRWGSSMAGGGLCLEIKFPGKILKGVLL